jgi:CRISPR/Cas system-associated exonuclease Cas4 (RecB family)
MIAYRQCPKRLWLQIHKPDVAEVSSQSKANFATGNQVGDIAIDGALALADVLKVDQPKRSKHWHMVEVKSSTSVKEVHLEDTAFQSFVVSHSGVKLSGVSLACIDSRWTYTSEGDYRGLLKEHDLTEQAKALQDDVEVWLAEAHKVAKKRKEPELKMGNQCNNPYECEFKAYCARHLVKPEFPVDWLPRRAGKLKGFIETNEITDMRDVPDYLLNIKQILV